MPGTFFGIEIGARGLAASQIGQDVTGHNISNAGTAGYSVQSVSQEATDPYTPPDANTQSGTGMFGTGVIARTINRARDQFLDAQTRDANSGHSLQSAQRDALKEVDSAFGEPSSTGINAALSGFFNSFSDLANNPEDQGIRATTLQKGDALARVFQSVQGSLTSISTQLSGKVGYDLQSVNDYGSQIAALNITIRQSTAAGQQPNDLLDRRDLLVDKLSGLANISVLNNADGTVNVAIGTSDLVVGTNSNTLTMSGMAARGDLKGGDLAGLVQSQADVAGYNAQFNSLAASVVSQVNAIHSTGAGLDGSTGLNFFTATAGSEAGTIAVNQTLVNNPSKLAAASAPVPPASPIPAPGDASNAVKLAALETQVVTTPGDPLNGQSLQSYYHQTVSDVGGREASAGTAADSAAANLAQLTQQRASVTGVSTDSEMINMMKYQRSYQASARVVQTMDAMVGTLITDLFPPGG